MLLASRFHALQHGHRVGIEHVRHDHADQARASPLEAARHLVRLVAEARDGAGDLLADVLGQGIEFAAEKARHARLRHACLARHLGDGHGPCRLAGNCFFTAAY
ncbi:hypothetical protein D3C72_1636180 [compost metagenome]